VMPLRRLRGSRRFRRKGDMSSATSARRLSGSGGAGHDETKRRGRVPSKLPAFPAASQ
jgi:hypothetical protein